ncbi:hypothetical protein UlMin_026529 [Ulmus minor]
MVEDGVVTVYSSTAITDVKRNPFSIKVGMAQMLRGSEILEAINAKKAILTEDAGAYSVFVSNLGGIT